MWCRRRNIGEVTKSFLLSHQVCSPGKIWLQRTVNVERDLGEISHCIRNMKPSQLTSTVWGGWGGGWGGGEGKAAFFKRCYFTCRLFFFFLLLFFTHLLLTLHLTHPSPTSSTPFPSHRKETSVAPGYQRPLISDVCVSQT